MQATTTNVKALLTVPDGADGNPLIADADIDVIVALDNNVYRAAASVCRRIATYYYSRVDIKGAGGEIKRSQEHGGWMRLASTFERKARITTSVGSPCATGLDDDPAFAEGQFDHSGDDGYRGE